MSSFTESTVVTYISITCYSCGIKFFVPKDWYDERIRQQDRFYCPNDHGQNFTGEKPEEALKRRVEYLEREVDSKRERIGHLERSRSTLHGAITKLKKRIIKVGG